MRETISNAAAVSLAKGTLVTGDFIIDQHIYEGARYQYADPNPGVHVKLQTGGAGILANLLQELFQRSDSEALKNALDVCPQRIRPDQTLERATANEAATPLAYQAYAFWRPQPDGEPREKQYWRCTEAMGFGAHDALRQPQNPPGACAETKDTDGSASLCDQPPCQAWPMYEPQLTKPAFIVISEGGMGFRGTQVCWENLPFHTAQQIILKTASRPTEGQLWKQLSSNHKEKLTVIVSASELRRSSARISTGLTWEETFQDFLRELDRGPLQELKNCRNLLVTFDNEAAAAVQFVSPGDLSGATVTFVYSPSAIEADVKNEIEGTAFGFLTCFTAAVTLAIARGEDQDLGPALEAGLSAMRNLLQKGHGSAMEVPQGFPIQRVADVILDPKEIFTTVAFPFEDLATFGWTFLGLAERRAVNKTEAAFEFARLTAIYGPVALANLPHLRIGAFLTVDGNEITALRNLRQVLRRYDKFDSGKKPLSVGVFGPPGAGKSFAVQEIASHLLGKKGAWLEFNLSQFDGPKDLIGAFHQVRDHVLQGKLPIAFFDEFDSQKYFWLQYLLAPMQDGRFQEGELTHALGKCIFIFAGGTSWTFDTFGPSEPSHSDDERYDKQEQAHGEFRFAKGPDFLSRLDAYLNVVGPNPRTNEFKQAANAAGSSPPSAAAKPATHRVGSRRLVDDEADIWWPIRRALMLRHTLKLKPDTKLDIDPGLLNALLRVPRYRYGSRSMEKILFPVLTSKIFRPSFVPHRSQLELHADPDRFMELLTAPPTIPRPTIPGFSEKMPKIAAEIHNTWNELMVRSGYRKQSETKTLDKEQSEIVTKINELEQTKAQLANPQSPEKIDELNKIEQKLRLNRANETKAASNTAAAERIPDILAIVGLSPSTQAADSSQAIRLCLEFHLELLASEEHRRWMDWNFSKGWTYNAKRDDGKFQHNCLKPYSELPEQEKMKDRTSIRHYLDVLSKVGYSICDNTLGSAKAT